MENHDWKTFTENDLELIKKRIELLERGSEELIEELSKIIDYVFSNENEPIIGEWLRSFSEEIDIIYTRSQVDE